MASEDLLAAIMAGPGGGAAPVSGGQAKPIGIPDTFKPYVKPAGRPGALDSSGRPARQFVPDAREPYYDGAEYAPRELSPESRARLQATMAQAGLIGKNDTYRLGVWDETSSKAYRKVLEHANRGGTDWQSALEELLAAPQMNADGTQAGSEALQPDPGRVSRTSNPLDLESQMQAAAQQRLGRKLRKQEVSKFVALYQGLEGKQNARINSAADHVEAGTDVTIQDAASPDAAADQFLDSNFAQEEAGQDAYGYLGALRNLIGG